MSAASDALRAKMAGPPAAGRSRSMKNWFATHPDAFEMLSVWMEMRREYVTDWTLSRVLKELREEYAFPFTVSPPNFGGRLREDYPEQYTRS